MARRIPPLNPLRMFDAVARHENLTKAANELHVTQSAVSRQIALLEDYLGVQLFYRNRHGVNLTREGKEYASMIIPAFAAIGSATEALIQDREGATLRLRTYMTFAFKWLIPHLAEFEALHPDIELDLNIAVPEVDFDRDHVDAAIQFGDGHWDKSHADLLFADMVEPVCSPRFFEQYCAMGQDPVHLLEQRLLVSQYRRTDWAEWLAATQLTDAASRAERMTFSSSVLTYRAAIDGLGVAMGQTAMLSQEFESGQLVRPFNRPLKRELGYYLLRPIHGSENAHVAKLRAWLMDVAARQ